MIGDPRNDENLIVAQLHLAFLKFHNRVLDDLIAEDDTETDECTYSQAEDDQHTPFHRARRKVRWHYQWIVLKQFLPTIVMDEVLQGALENGPEFYKFDQEPFTGRPYMPLEFSVAVYRFGHSMIRDSYNYNRFFSDAGQVPGGGGAASLGQLFSSLDEVAWCRSPLTGLSTGDAFFK